MALIVAVLAVISLVAGGFLGTFRHRAYGVWSLAGVLIAIVTANVVGTSIGVWMAASIGTTEASPVLVLVKTSVLLLVSLIISYYASDLLPAQNDPKTRTDNIIAGFLGVFNAYLVIATVLVYVQGLNNSFSVSLFGDGQSFNFNRMFVDGLPWITSVLVLTIVGWSSVCKFMQAWAKLRGTSNTTPPPSTGSMTTGTNYQYSSPTSGFNPSFGPSSGAVAPPPAAENTEKKGWFGSLGGWFRRNEKQSDADTGGTNAPISSQTPAPSSYSPATYQGTSGATPPYGIATGNTGYNSSYNSTPTTGSSYTNTSTSYSAPAYSTGYSATPAAPASASGYSSTSYTAPATSPGYSPSTSYTPPATNSGYSSTYSPPPASPSYPSSYGGTSTTGSTSYPSSYTPATGTPSTYNTYNPGVSSGFAAPNPPSATDAAIGGLAAGGLAGGLLGATYNPSMSGGFSDMNDYQDNDEESDFFDEDEDDDAQDGYSPSYRG